MTKASELLSLLENIRTHTGSKIQRSKHGVGKEMGGQMYVHKDYAHEAIPHDVWHKAKSLVPKDHSYNTVMHDPKKKTVRFDEAPDFDKAREPIPGKMVTVNYHTGEVSQPKHSDSIWHHKWLWVKDNYKGFDVNKSKDWSHKWTSKFKETAIGRKHLWNAQLKKYGLEGE